MRNWFSDNKNKLFAIVATSVLIPMLIIAYILIVRGEDFVSLSFNSPIGFIIILYYILLIVISVLSLLYWLISQIMFVKRLKAEKTKVELAHLKAQMNPHFFFNMLNSLYGWIDKDTKQAKELILKLSDMMRYSIYEGQKDMVLLIEEIDFLKKYIELNKIRYHKNIDIDFSINLENSTIKIMPLMYIILLENAFKHGVEKMRDNAFVHIKLKANDQKVNFEIMNNYDDDINSSPGIGIENLKSRLNIIYPDRYVLTSNIEKGIYSSSLTLTI